MLQQPESMEQLVYFTQRTLGDKGTAKVWVFRQDCPKCKKAQMGKPVEKGKVKVRAPEYVCPECNYTVEKKEYEESLEANIEYTCPECQHKGELQIPFKRRNIQGVQTLRAQCGSCSANIDITKKMKQPKKKGKALPLDE